MHGGGELEGFGVIDPGLNGEGQQGAEQDHVGQLQPLRSESGTERVAEEAVVEPLVPGGDDPAGPDVQRQGEHQHSDREEAQPAAAVPIGHDHQDGEGQDQVAPGQQEPAASRGIGLRVRHRQGQGQRDDRQAGDRQAGPVQSEQGDQGQAELGLQDHHGQRGDQGYAEDGVTRPPGDRPGSADMVGWRAKGQHHTDHR